jgi:4-hydroxybenzoate polyprenyltransferase
MSSWTIIYDTIYACQDREDDAKAGLKSTAVLFGSHVRVILSFFAMAFIICLIAAGIANRQGLWYFLLSVGGAALHLMWQLYSVTFEDEKDCWKKFLVRGRAHNS